MKLFAFGKDGGPKSTVYGFWLVEIKPLFSIALLKFNGKSREAFHSHAFNSVSWVLRGRLIEHNIENQPSRRWLLSDSDVYVKEHVPGIWPVVTKRETFHKVDSRGTTYVLTFRGPWSKTWQEYTDNRMRVLTHGRLEVTKDKWPMLAPDEYRVVDERIR